MIRDIINAIKGHDRGQALIELSISLPLLMLMLLGATELGRVAYASIEVTNAAKAAAQFAASNGGAFTGTALDSSGMLVAARADAGDLGNSVSFASGYPTMTCSCSGTGTATCSVPVSGCNPPLSKPIVTITVRTTTSYNPLVFIPGLPHGSFTLYGWAQQKVLPL